MFTCRRQDPLPIGVRRNENIVFFVYYIAGAVKKFNRNPLNPKAAPRKSESRPALHCSTFFNDQEDKSPFYWNNASTF
ncbi:hypothetical protein ACFL5P_03020 [candidate division KSB1 bacterium]